MTTLLHPITRQPCEFVASLRGMIAIRCDYVSRQVRWFPVKVIETVNAPADVMDAILCYDINEARCELLDTGNAEHWNSRALYETKLYRDIAAAINPPKPLTVVLTPEMAAHVNASALVEIVVRKPAPVISLYAEALRAA